MIENLVRAKLLSGGTALGVMAFEFFTPGLARVLKAGGAEFVILDTEHSGAGMDTLKSAIAYARGAGIVPMVRVPGLARHLISPVLDAGAMGIMVPMLETADQARELVSYCRYRPLGTRGLAFGMAHDDYETRPIADAITAANNAILTIPLTAATACGSPTGSTRTNTRAGSRSPTTSTRTTSPAGPPTTTSATRPPPPRWSTSTSTP